MWKSARGFSGGLGVNTKCARRGVRGQQILESVVGPNVAVQQHERGIAEFGERLLDAAARVEQLRLDAVADTHAHIAATAQGALDLVA